MYATHEQHGNNVLTELNEMREQAELTDVVLEVEGKSFPCHRAVLASCSRYFRTMFTSGYKEAKQERVLIQDVSGVAMATILDYAYTGYLQTEPDQVQAVMSAARLLQVDFVCQRAAKYMADHLDMSNCVDALMYADMLGDCGQLMENSEKYIASRFNQVALQPSFLQLSLLQLRSLLDSDDLMTTSEDDVVVAALRWIEFNQDERLKHLPALCKSFRRSLISSEKHAEIKSRRPSTDGELVFSKSTTQRLGQVRTEMQIVPEVPIEVQDDLMDDSYSQWSAPCYNPSTGGLDVINMPRNLGSFSLTSTPDDLYLAGGVRGSKKVSRQKAFYQYNQLLHTWEPRCEMISARVGCGLVHLKGYIYAIGGDNTKGTAERYDPSTDEWTSMPPIPHPMSGFLQFCTVTLDDSIYVISKEGLLQLSVPQRTSGVR
ncbi:kelch repeat and BTB domain-containing protein 2-like [Branchiostoma floridae]|uniref:Kelch repeat and BTB domain-containing protein 2-like n=2 Tax=Branchiostoma floridae TaxID=7739 RepID=A0A9J7MCR9_BRAFL|nr:kelch repeat and BTB domain-containing protein 2-like [Branchiostoma floridae]